MAGLGYWGSPSYPNRTSGLPRGLGIGSYRPPLPLPGQALGAKGSQARAQLAPPKDKIIWQFYIQSADFEFRSLMTEAEG